MITSVRLQQFRSYTEGLFEFENGVTIIVGPNGSGKTSVIEALHYACTGVSFRGSDEDVLQSSKDWARIDALFSDGSNRTVKLVRGPERVQRTYEIDDVIKKRLSPNLKIPVVLFQPQDMSILTGEPQARRDMLDAILQKIVPSYEQNLKNYKRILHQRNALLKSERKPQKDELFVWDLRLSEFGGVIHGARQAYIDAVAKNIQKEYKAISSKKDAVEALYVYDVQGADYAAGMLKQLSERYEKDIARGFTSVGPHRDDLSLTIKGEDVRTAASRGETRSLLLALKIIEMKHMEHVSGIKPTVLLDDVFSELDGARRQLLASVLAPYQTVITTTDADLAIDYFSNKAHLIALG